MKEHFFISLQVLNLLGTLFSLYAWKIKLANKMKGEITMNVDFKAVLEGAVNKAFEFTSIEAKAAKILTHLVERFATHANKDELEVILTELDTTLDTVLMIYKQRKFMEKCAMQHAMKDEQGNYIGTRRDEGGVF